MASRFAKVLEDEILTINEVAVTVNTNKAMTSGLSVFTGR